MKVVKGMFLIIVAILLITASVYLIRFYMGSYTEVEIQVITKFIEDSSKSISDRRTVGGVGIILILGALYSLYIAYRKFKPVRTYTFQNPQGDVTVSVTAIEDFIKKTGAQIPEVKEIKPKVIIEKKKIEIVARLSIGSSVNVPEATERIQAVLKKSIRDIIGIEDEISIRIFIVKIIPEEGKKENEPYVGYPFRG